ncbi:MAG: hypothetical protein MK195_07215 [Acidimicrobiales bacterium]|nr:hypothetical protein [Acidimicrobiales bacterium]|tara:strand:+ start:382 stop:702 length:321 start_codon:yes stop_codon:yes gene_type:complete
MNGANMQIIATTAWDVKPTHFVEFMANCLKAKEIHERLGAEQVRLVQSMAGPTPGLVYALIFPDGAAFGSFIDAIRTDEEWLAFWAEAAGDYATIISQSVGTDLLS